MVSENHVPHYLTILMHMHYVMLLSVYLTINLLICNKIHSDPQLTDFVRFLHLLLNPPPVCKQNSHINSTAAFNGDIRTAAVSPRSWQTILKLTEPLAILQKDDALEFSYTACFLISFNLQITVRFNKLPNLRDGKKLTSKRFQLFG